MPYTKKQMRRMSKKIGIRPINPFGTCFDSAFKILYAGDGRDSSNIKLCHGIIMTNLPGETRRKSGHAWIEFTRDGERLALEPIWGVATGADFYRTELHAEHVVEYTRSEAIKNWHNSDQDNCWDDVIKSWSEW